MNVSKKLGFEALVLGACLFIGTALPAVPTKPASTRKKKAAYILCAIGDWR